MRGKVHVCPIFRLRFQIPRHLVLAFPHGADKLSDINSYHGEKVNKFNMKEKNGMPVMKSFMSTSLMR